MSKVSGQNLIISTKSDSLSLLQQEINLSIFQTGFVRQKLLITLSRFFWALPHIACRKKSARHIAVVTDITKDIYDNNLIILETGLPEKDKTLALAKTSLTATVYLPDVKENWTIDALKREAGSILDRLEKFLPFLKDNIELVQH